MKQGAAIVPAAETEEDSRCKSCNDPVPTAQQHFIRLTSPLLTRSYLLCVECWSSFLHELDGSWDDKVIDI